jgi:hypothetical protein
MLLQFCCVLNGTPCIMDAEAMFMITGRSYLFSWLSGRAFHFISLLVLSFALVYFLYAFYSPSWFIIYFHHYDLHRCFQTASTIYFSRKEVWNCLPSYSLRITPAFRCLDHTPNKCVREVVARSRRSVLSESSSFTILYSYTDGNVQKCNHVQDTEKTSEADSFKNMRVITSYTPEDGHIGRNM